TRLSRDWSSDVCSSDLNDILAKTLRTPGKAHDSFSDDPLRMLRAARFSSQLGFVPDPEVFEAIADMKQRLEIVSPERIKDELNRSEDRSVGKDWRYWCV